MIDLLIMIGVGTVAFYYTIKVYSGNCNPQIPLAIEPNYDEDEVPPKYEDIVAENI
jgi:hypothetical protein|tara:strand:+ start:83 stop:250 length:168 start_codon:yes stop_codon:yes gene_type:complete